jgi:hypothetical protein
MYKFTFGVYGWDWGPKTICSPEGKNPAGIGPIPNREHCKSSTLASDNLMYNN